MRQKYMFLTIGMLAIAVLFFVLSGSMIGKKAKDIGSLDTKIKAAQEKLNSAKILDQQLSQFSLIIQNSLTKEKTFSPMEVNAFVKNLANLADQNHIGVLAIYPKEIQSSLHMVEQQYILELNTTYVQLGQYLANLEALDNIIKINTLDVTPITDTDTNRQNQKAVVSAPRVARYKVALELSVLKVQREA